MSYDFDRNLGSFVFTFTEVIDIVTSSFDFTTLTVQHFNLSSPELRHSIIEEGMIQSAGLNYRPVYVLQPSVNDVNDIKRIEGLATAINNTYITVTNASCEDLAGNQLVGIYDGTALQANDVTLDISPPVLMSFDFDLNAGILMLTFDEVVDASSLVIEQIQFVSENSSMSNDTYFLTGNSNVTDYNDLVLIIAISDFVLNNIKFYQNLASSVMTTYLNLSADTVNDTSGNGILAFNTPQPLAYGIH